MKIIEAAAFWFSFAYKAIDLFIERYIIVLCNTPKYTAHALYNKQTIVLLKWERREAAMICALIGDQTIRNLNEERLELRLRTLIEQEHVSAFVLGYFGPFERLAFRVIRRLQQDYPLLDYTVILCGLRKERPAEPELDYLHTLYPQGCWLWPGRIGLTQKLCYLASASDMIAYYDDTEQRRAASWIRRAARRKRLCDTTLE